MNTIDGFTVVVVSWNNLSFLKLLIHSLKKNSYYKNHEILVHLNESQDDEIMWLKDNNINFTESKTNNGLSGPANKIAQMATKPWLCFIDDDMYVLPDWDKGLIDARNSQKNIWISSTMIEPVGPSTSIIKNFGNSANLLREDDLLEFYKNVKAKCWRTNSATPLLFKKDEWNMIGGYDELFPAVGAELGLAKRCWDILGFRDFISTNKSFVYHFRSKSMKKISTNPSLRDRRFNMKYNMTASKFRNMIKKNEIWEL